jgi:hypothetical protein
MKRELRTRSVGTKVSEAELRVLESRAAAAGLTLSEWVRAADAAKGEANPAFGHGVSTTIKPRAKYTGFGTALRSEVEKFFEVNDTGPPGIERRCFRNR